MSAEVLPAVLDERGKSRRSERCLHPFLLPVWSQETHERFAATGQRATARCRWCESCVRIAEREWVRTIQAEAPKHGAYVGYMVLSISTTGRATGAVYEDLQRCRELFIKRLRHRATWRKLVWRLEAGSTGLFPHLNLLFFGWGYYPKAKLHRMWSSVTLEVTGTRGTADRIAAVGSTDAGRLAHYTFKEALLGVASYTWKEGRPMWLPKHRRMWAKSRSCDVYAWPRRSRSEGRILDAREGPVSFPGGDGYIALGALLGAWRLAGQGRDRSPPEHVQAALF